MSVPSVAPVSAALVSLVGTATGRPVGDGKLPTAADPPFAVVFSLFGGDFWGPGLVSPQTGAAFDFQVTSVAVSRSGAEAHADAVRHALLDRTANGAFVNVLAVAGVAVLDRELVAYGGLQEELGAFNVPDQYRIHVTLT